MGAIVFQAVVLVISFHFGYCNFEKPIHPKDLPNREETFRLQPKVVNGNLATGTQFPWQVSIKSFSDKQPTSICGGSIISSDVVLTAGHCTHNFRSFELGFGSHIFSAPLVRQSLVARIEHPNYNPENLNNDIALIPLQYPLTFGINIQPIKLPTLSQEHALFLNHRAVASGFGKTSDSGSISTFLKWVNLRIILNDDCAKVFGREVVVPSIICARGWDTSSQNICQGDSGGGAAWNNHGQWIQVGIVSFVSSKGCAHGHPSGFTRVTSYLQWISQNSGIALRN